MPELSVLEPVKPYLFVSNNDDSSDVEDSENDIVSSASSSSINSESSVNTEPNIVNIEPNIVNIEPNIVNTESKIVNTESKIVNINNLITDESLTDKSESDNNDSEDEDYIPSGATDHESDISEAEDNDKVRARNDRTLLVYESKLFKLLHHCPKCGSPVDTTSIQEMQQTGSQLHLKFTCFSNCDVEWKSQPKVGNLKRKSFSGLLHCIFRHTIC